MNELYTEEETRSLLENGLEQYKKNHPSMCVEIHKEASTSGMVNVVGLLYMIHNIYEVAIVAEKIIDAKEDEIFHIVISSNFKAQNTIHKFLASAMAYSKGRITFSMAQMSAASVMDIMSHYA